MSAALAPLALTSLLSACSSTDVAPLGGLGQAAGNAGNQAGQGGGAQNGGAQNGGAQNGGAQSGGGPAGGQGGSSGGDQAGSGPSSGGAVDLPAAGGSAGASTGGGGGASGAPVVTAPGPCTSTVCEDFEGVAVGSPPSNAVWKSIGSGIVVDSAHAFRGSKAMHIPPMKKGSAMIKTSMGLPLPGKVLFGRLYLWIENAPPFGSAYLHQAVVTAEGTSLAGVHMQHHFGGQHHSNAGPFTYLSYNNWSEQGGHGGPVNAVKHPVGLPVKSWHCLEFSFDTNLSKATFWWNGEELTAIGYTNPPGKPVYDFPPTDLVGIGWTEFHDPSAPWEVWIDEIAIGATRIGCLAPP